MIGDMKTTLHLQKKNIPIQVWIWKIYLLLYQRKTPFLTSSTSPWKVYTWSKPRTRNPPLLQVDLDQAPVYKIMTMSIFPRLHSNNMLEENPLATLTQKILKNRPRKRGDRLISKIGTKHLFNKCKQTPNNFCLSLKQNYLNSFN